MASLNSLLAAHGVVLLIDSSAARVNVGLLRREAGAAWRQSPREAGIAIFEGVDGVLAEAGIGVHDLGAFVFCEGPGSTLGIRTAAMALRTWQVAGPAVRPAYAYRSLELVAHDLQSAEVRLPFAVIADARRNAWHFVAAADGQVIGPLQRVPRATVADFPGELYMPADFRAWAAPPRPARSIPYPVPQLWQRQGDADLLRPAPQPDAFLHEESTYAAWTPQIHRAPRPKTP
jgi:tRNA threonylcarbamoyladenosine biosynthesis protein TsaB